MRNSIDDNEGGRADSRVRPILSRLVFALFFLITVALVFAPLVPSFSLNGFAVLKGNVADSEGGALPGARVRIVNLKTGSELSTDTDKHGDFLFAGLEAGDYSIEAWDKCFERWSNPDLKLTPGTQHALNIRLRLCLGTHLDNIRQNFSTQTHRFASNDSEEQLINRAEKLPCGDRSLPANDLSPPAMPKCANVESREYYFDLVGKNRAGLLPEAGEGPVFAKAYYEAKVEYSLVDRKPIVKLRLEYAVRCGILCGQTVVRTRWVFFDEKANVVKVEDNRDCDCYMVS